MYRPWRVKVEQSTAGSAPESVKGARPLSKRAHLFSMDADRGGNDGLWGSYRAPALLATTSDTPDWSGLEIGFTLLLSRSTNGVTLNRALLQHSPRH